jgi:hypothetical protein
MASKNKIMHWIREQYGNWSVRYSEGFFLYGAFSSGLTSFWVIQNILKESYQWQVPLVAIVLVFFVLFNIVVYVLDKTGFIESRQNAMSKRNKYFRRIKK